MIIVRYLNLIPKSGIEKMVTAHSPPTLVHEGYEKSTTSGSGNIKSKERHRSLRLYENKSKVEKILSLSRLWLEYCCVWEKPSMPEASEHVKGEIAR